MATPIGLPMAIRVVLGGSGGTMKNAIPVREDVAGGTILAYLPNDTLVKIVDPEKTDPAALSRYRKVWNGSTYVRFWRADGSEYLQNNDAWCEENSHLFPVTVTPPPVEHPIKKAEIIGFRNENGKIILEYRDA